MRQNKAKHIYMLMIIVLIILSIISMFCGRFVILPNEILSEQSLNVLLNSRMPRVLMSIICGGALGICGSIFQIVFRNYLASPDIIGVASTSSVGASFAIVFFSGGAFLIQAMSFLFGIIAVILVLIIASLNRKNYILSLIISGVIIGSICSSIVMILKYISDPNSSLLSIDFWLMGGLGRVNVKGLIISSVIIAVVFIILYSLRYRLKVISLSDEEVMVLGVNINFFRILFIILATLLVSTVVSNCGVISWIGLIAPYISRLLVKNFIPLSFIIGSIILLVSDTLARTLTTAEIPVGIIISLISAPFLIYLLIKEGNKSSVKS